VNPFATIPIEERYAEFHKRYPALNLIGNTRMVEILCFKDEFPDVEVYAKVEFANPGGSLKDRPVRRMLLEALIQGKIGKGQVVLDSSSGNAGIAYAMLGAMMNVPVQIVVPGNASRERKLRIKAHGAALIQTDPLEGYDGPEVLVAERIAEGGHASLGQGSLSAVGGAHLGLPPGRAKLNPLHMVCAAREGNQHRAAGEGRADPTFAVVAVTDVASHLGVGEEGLPPGEEVGCSATGRARGRSRRCPSRCTATP